MAFDLQEQEQIDSLKIFWGRWGKWIAGAVVVLVVAFLGYKGYGLYRAHQIEASAALYVKVEQSAKVDDLAQIRKDAATIETDYPASPYAVRAAFLAAKVGFDKNDSGYARAQLEWAEKNARESALVALAQLRLAGLMADAKQYDAAIAQLNRPHDNAFAPLFDDAKGDVFSLKGDKSAARDAYRSALSKLSADAPNRQYVQAKLDALGG